MVLPSAAWTASVLIVPPAAFTVSGWAGFASSVPNSGEVETIADFGFGGFGVGFIFPEPEADPFDDEVDGEADVAVEVAAAESGVDGCTMLECADAGGRTVRGLTDAGDAVVVVGAGATEET